MVVWSEILYNFHCISDYAYGVQQLVKHVHHGLALPLEEGFRSRCANELIHFTHHVYTFKYFPIRSLTYCLRANKSTSAAQRNCACPQASCGTRRTTIRWHLKKKVVHSVLQKVVHCTTFWLTQVVYYKCSTVYYF